MTLIQPHTLTRREALLAAIAASTTTASASAAPNTADNIFDGLPLIALNEGRWDGTYRFVKPDGTLVEQYDFRIRVSLSRDNQRAYRQDSYYTYPDGTKQSIVFEAPYRNGRLIWDSGRIFGQLWEITDDTIYLVFGFNAVPNTVCHEMIQTQPDGLSRGRTWLWYVDGRLDRYTLIDEQRVADDSPLD